MTAIYGKEIVTKLTYVQTICFNTHALGNLSLVLIVSNLVLYKMNNLLKVFLFNPKNKFQSSTLCPYFLHRSVFTLQRHV